MIRFEHVSKAYLGGRQALQGVTFHLQPGEMAFLTCSKRIIVSPLGQIMPQ